jgi:putative transposase
MVEALQRPFESTQYTSFAFGKRCREMGVVPSVGSIGDAYDNAMAESFFATLECELLDRRCFHIQAEAKLAVFEFIEGFYNPRRRHSSLGYRSPIRFEQELISGNDRPNNLPLNAADRAAVKADIIRKEEEHKRPTLRH